MRLRLKLGAVAMAGGVAGLLVVGVPALASSHQSSVKTATGPEIIYGTVHGKAAIVRLPQFLLTFKGLVYANKVSFALGSSGPLQTLSTPAGKVTIQIAGLPQVSSQANLRTCHATFTQRQGISIVGSKSTGVFAGASGPGAFQIYRSAYWARFTSGPNKGKCNRSDLLAKGATSSLIVSVVLTIRK
jgi:hypothetical protein